MSKVGLEFPVEYQKEIHEFFSEKFVDYDEDWDEEDLYEEKIVDLDILREDYDSFYEGPEVTNFIITIEYIYQWDEYSDDEYHRFLTKMLKELKERTGLYFELGQWDGSENGHAVYSTIDKNKLETRKLIRGISLAYNEIIYILKASFDYNNGVIDQEEKRELELQLEKIKDGVTGLDQLADKPYKPRLEVPRF